MHSQRQKKCTTTQKTKARLVTFYDIWKWSGSILKGKDKYEKSEEKRISREAYEINKQTIYIAPKLKIESRVHYTQELNIQK